MLLTQSSKKCVKKKYAFYTHSLDFFPKVPKTETIPGKKNVSLENEPLTFLKIQKSYS